MTHVAIKPRSTSKQDLWKRWAKLVINAVTFAGNYGYPDEKQMTKRTEINYEADGLKMASDFYADDATQSPRPGILVFPGGYGLTEHARSRAKKLAGLGYAVLACDLHGQGKVAKDKPEMEKWLAPLDADPARIRTRAEGGLRALKELKEVDCSRIAAIGFCIGGTMALELARGGERLAGVVGFHSGLATAAPLNAKGIITGKVLVCTGADDPYVPLKERLRFEFEMSEGGVDWRMHVYGGVLHSFTDRDAPDAAKLEDPKEVSYNGGADYRSWSETIALLSEIFPLTSQPGRGD